MGLWRCENPDCQKGKLLPRRSGDPPGQPRRRAVDRLPLWLYSKIGSTHKSAVAVRWIGDRPYCPKCHAQFQRCCLAPSLRTHTCIHMCIYIYMYIYIYVCIYICIYVCLYTYINVLYTLSYTHTLSLSLAVYVIYVHTCTLIKCMYTCIYTLPYIYTLFHLMPPGMEPLKRLLQATF